MQKTTLCVQSSLVSKELQFRHVESSVISSNYVQPAGLSEAQMMFACFFPQKVSTKEFCLVSHFKLRSLNLQSQSIKQVKHGVLSTRMALFYAIIGGNVNKPWTHMFACLITIIKKSPMCACLVCTVCEL